MPVRRGHPLVDKERRGGGFGSPRPAGIAGDRECVAAQTQPSS